MFRVLCFCYLESHFKVIKNNGVSLIAKMIFSRFSFKSGLP
jgi:hypothetical protein